MSSYAIALTSAAVINAMFSNRLCRPGGSFSSVHLCNISEIASTHKLKCSTGKLLRPFDEMQTKTFPKNDAGDRKYVGYIKGRGSMIVG